MTFPYVYRSAAIGSPMAAEYADQPPRDTRNPVITSSRMSSAPWRWATSARKALKPGAGGTTPMLPGAASVMIAAIPSGSAANAASIAARGVVRQHDRLAGGRCGHARRIGQSEGGHARTGGGQQPIGVPVIAALELDDLRSIGGTPGQPDRAHRRLGAGVDQADHLDRRYGPPAPWPGRPPPGWARRSSSPAPRPPPPPPPPRVRVPMDERPPRGDQVDVAPAVRVEEVRTLAPDHEPRHAADLPEGPHGRVDPTGHDCSGPVEKRLRGGRVSGIQVCHGTDILSSQAPRAAGPLPVAWAA